MRVALKEWLPFYVRMIIEEKEISLYFLGLFSYCKMCQNVRNPVYFYNFAKCKLDWIVFTLTD